MSLPIKKARLEFTYEELKLLGIYIDLDSSDNSEEKEILERLYARFETTRAKLDPKRYKQGY